MNPKDTSPASERRADFFSCAFCHTSSAKPFKICETCGSAQPGENEPAKDGEEE